MGGAADGGGVPLQPTLGSGAAAFAADPVGLLDEGSNNGAGDVERVWSHYVQVMKPRKRELLDEERRLIRDALKVATPDEVCAAIDGCASSDFHMGRNDRGRKYNKLAQIIKGRRGHNETTRDRIEFFLDMAEKRPFAGGLPSASRAKVDQAKRNVLDGWHFKGDEDAQRRAAASEKWLAEIGVRVKRSNVDGRPTFG